MSYTDTQKQEAIQVYLEDGAATAAAQTGCDRATIYRWLGRYATGVADEKAQERRTETVERHQVKRQAISELLLDKTLDLLNRMDEQHIDFKGSKADQVTFPVAPAEAVRAYATSIGILIDKYRLEAGEYTDRTYREGSDDTDRRIQQLVGELDARAKAEARQGTVA